MSFDTLAAQLQEEYEKQAPRDRKWLPPDGDYDAFITSFRTGSYQEKKTGVEVPFVATSYELNGGDFDGVNIDGGMIAIRSPKSLRVARQHVERGLGATISGVFKDDCDALREAVANAPIPCKIRIVSSTGNDGREWRNVYLQSASPAAA